MADNRGETQKYFDRAARVIPHGVNSNFRFWGPDETLVIDRGEGAYIWDMDGRRYIDYRMAFGPVILGHAYPPVVEAVHEALAKGNLFAWTTPLEIDVAERIARMTNVEKVRITNTGTEATMHALRIARGYTGREHFIKFEGHYHGMADYFMFSTASAPRQAVRSRRSPVAVPASSGIPKGISEYVTVLPFNDVEMLENRVRGSWGELAAIIVEPIMGNVASIMPKDGFLQTIRALCDEFGIVMIMDEVKTGFRIARGGAQEYFGIQADLVTYAKAMGNGFPIAAIGGKEDVMMTIAPNGVAHGGTYSGNVVGAAAASATLNLLENEPIIKTINQRGQLLMSGIGEILADADVPGCVTGVPSMFGILLGSHDVPQEFRTYAEADAAFYERVAMELIRRGVQPDSDGREPWFMSYSHSEQDVATTLEAFEDALQAAKKTQP